MKRWILGSCLIFIWALGFLVPAGAQASTAAAGKLTAAPPGSRPPAAKSLPRVHMVDLHAAYEAHLGHTKKGKIAGVVYPRNKQPKASKIQASCAEPDCPLVYQGGNVQPDPHLWLLLWGPNWSSDPSQAATANYLESFYAGLGVQPGDDWSTTTDQYCDSSGGCPYFNHPVLETTTQDASTPPYGATYSQLAAEADAFASSEGLSDLNDQQIIVATQSGTCPQGFYAPNCDTSGTYCAWHSSSNEPFTNLPYVLDAGGACGENFVNSGSSGTYDGFSIVGGHEYAETVTDPEPDSGWIDLSSNGGEVGDKCAWNSLSSDVELGTGSFAMQPLYSNNDYGLTGTGCTMSSAQGDQVSVTNPGNQTTFTSANLNLQINGSSSGGNTLTWGSSGLPGGLSINSSNGLISGQITGTGTFNVTVAAKDQTGATGSVDFTWAIKPDVGTAVKGNGGLCLDDAYSMIMPGNGVDGFVCNRTGAQKWKLSSSELHVLGQCLTDPNKGGIGTDLVIDPCKGTATQLWTHKSNDEYVVRANGLCMTEQSPNVGYWIIVAKCKDTASQKWSGS